MTTVVVSEPAEAIAMGRCLTARSIVQPPRSAVTASHPRPCGWCDWDLDALRQMVEAFNTWAGYSSRSNSYAHHELRVWQDLPRAEQERRIVEAQAFPAEPLPESVVEPVVAIEDEEDAWLKV